MAVSVPETPPAAAMLVPIQSCTAAFNQLSRSKPNRLAPAMTSQTTESAASHPVNLANHSRSSSSLCHKVERPLNSISMTERMKRMAGIASRKCQRAPQPASTIDESNDAAIWSSKPNRAPAGCPGDKVPKAGPLRRLCGGVWRKVPAQQPGGNPARGEQSRQETDRPSDVAIRQRIDPKPKGEAAEHIEREDGGSHARVREGETVPTRPIEQRQRQCRAEHHRRENQGHAGKERYKPATEAEEEGRRRDGSEEDRQEDQPIEDHVAHKQRYGRPSIGGSDADMRRQIVRAGAQVVQRRRLIAGRAGMQLRQNAGEAMLIAIDPGRKPAPI